jgi:hypothetical protein
MTDPRNAQPGSYGTSGYGAGTREQSPVASFSGRASVRPSRPDAASPAGWFPPPAGEAAPPVRPREPARSDGASSYDMETRPTSMYRVSREPARPGTGRPPLRRPQSPMAHPDRGMPVSSASRGSSADPSASEPDMRWPSLARQRPRHVPVVGPAEALHGRGGPAASVRPGAVRGPLDRKRQSGWQLAQRAWQNSGVDWEDAPVPDQADQQAYDAYQIDQYTDDSYAPGSFADPCLPDSYPEDADYQEGTGYRGDAGVSDEDEYYLAEAADVDDYYPGHDTRPARKYPAAPYAADQYLADPQSTRPDLPVLPPGDSRLGMGPWPVQQPLEATRPEPAIGQPEPRETREREDPESENHDLARRGTGERGGPGARDIGGRGPANRRADEHGPAVRGARGQEPGSAAAPDSVAKEAAPQAPPLPRRIRRMGDGRYDYPPSGVPSRSGAGGRGGQAPPLGTRAFAPSSEFAPSSPFALSPAFGASPAGAPRSSAPVPLSAPVAPAAPPLSESDELFRAWQGSVAEAASRRTPWTARRLPGSGEAGPRRLGWQIAKIGVPAAVIVTVGAGALMMLTGRANEMLADRASSGTLSSGQPSAGAASPGQSGGRATAQGRNGTGATGVALAGYPGEHGAAGIAALWSAGGTTIAVGYADAHPAVWRHASDGTWSLVSTAALGGLTGHLTSVAQGPSGWIAVGSMNENGTVEPVIFWSPDGVTWTPQPALTAVAGSSAQFLGVAAGPGGYLVVGKQGSGDQARVALWWSADLKNWANGNTNGSAGSFAAAAVAVGNGFIAVGSENNCHAIWTSPDGRNWTAHDLPKPPGTTAAILNSVTAGQGGRFVAAGYATGSAGDLPIVVTSADGGAQVAQAVLTAAPGPAMVTAVTATGNGFVAAGLAGPADAKHAVEWTSRDGVTWSAASPVASAGASEITALTDSGTTVAGTVQAGKAPSVLTLPAP